MKGLIQRVRRASVEIDDVEVGAIGNGILLLLGVERDDQESDADKLLQKILNYRIFQDTEQRMNLSLQDIAGGLLIVSQFTLVADTRKGLRPGFSRGASPAEGERLYDYFVDRAQQLHTPVATGRFGADMQIHLINDGPVTFMLESR